MACSGNSGPGSSGPGRHVLALVPEGHVSNTTEPAYRGAGKEVSTLGESSVQEFKTGKRILCSLTSCIYSCWALHTYALYICKDIRT